MDEKLPARLKTFEELGDKEKLEYLRVELSLLQNQVQFLLRHQHRADGRPVAVVEDYEFIRGLK